MKVTIVWEPGLSRGPIAFPQGTERTWCLTYVDSETRLVRAGVDGGRSVSRELGLIQKGEGESADAYLFVMTRVAGEPGAEMGLPAGVG